MGKSLNGKELGKGISQRKDDGLYVGRFTNRFGKRKTIYAKTLNEIRQKLRDEQYEDEKQINVVDSNVTLDEWFEIWIETCKKNCRNNTKDTYRRHYKRVKKDIGWRKLKNLNLVVLQEAINKLNTDNERKNSKKILVDMLNKAVDTDLLIKNIAKQIITDITREDKKPRRVMTSKEVDTFLEEAENTFYYNLFVVALETGMRIGEILGLKWEDIDFKNKIVHVRNSLTYFSNDGKYVFEMHPTKTKKGLRDIPLTKKAIKAFRQQYFVKKTVENKGKECLDGFEELVFVTKNNKPSTQFLVQESIDAIIKRINRDSEMDFERVTPHCFRHTFATRCLEAGVPMKTTSALLGHSQLQLTTDIYMHVTNDSLFEGIDLFENAKVKVG